MSMILGHIPPPDDDFTGLCPCGCGARFRNGEQVFGPYDHEDWCGVVRGGDCDCGALPRKERP